MPYRTCRSFFTWNLLQNNSPHKIPCTFRIYSFRAQALISFPEGIMDIYSATTPRCTITPLATASYELASLKRDSCARNHRYFSRNNASYHGLQIFTVPVPIASNFLKVQKYCAYTTAEGPFTMLIGSSLASLPSRGE